MENIALGIISVLLFVCLIVLFCVILVKLHIRKITSYHQVIYQKDIDFQKALNSTIIETQEQVLNNISQDLHDDAGQQLTLLSHQIELLRRAHEFNGALAPVSASVIKLQQSIRNISHSLNNQLLMQQDLFAAIDSEIKRVNQVGDIQFSCTMEQITPNFSSNEKILIYRIFQELVNNIFKHSAAKNVTVELRGKPFLLSVCDDGRGFDFEQARSSDSTLGILSIIDRANIIGFNVRFDTSPGKGTRVELMRSK